ncbi:unnamed protein product [Coccothraustes coccothraustes]
MGAGEGGGAEHRAERRAAERRGRAAGPRRDPREGSADSKELQEFSRSRTCAVGSVRSAHPRDTRSGLRPTKQQA